MPDDHTNVLSERIADAAHARDALAPGLTAAERRTRLAEGLIADVVRVHGLDATMAMLAAYARARAKRAREPEAEGMTVSEPARAMLARTADAWERAATLLENAPPMGV